MIVVILLVITQSIATAGTAPDTLNIISVSATRNLVETGDLLITVHYDIAWTVAADYPDDPASDTFIIQLLTTDKATIASINPYPFNTNGDYGAGYDEGVASFYFSASKVSALGLVWGTPYIVRISTELSFVDPVEAFEHAISDNDYCSDTDNRTYLADWVIDTAQSLEVNWGAADALTTVSIDTVLSEIGESYFGRVIYGLRDMCPGLFMATIQPPEYTESTWTGTKQAEWDGQWDGTPLEPFIDGIEGLTGNFKLTGNVLTIMGALVLMVVSFGMFSVARPGLLAGYMLLPVSTELGFFEYSLLGTISFGFIIFLGWKIFIKGAG